MLLILHRNIDLGRSVQTLALGLVLFALTILVACTNGDSIQDTEGPQPTATSTSASDSAAATPSDPPLARETATPASSPLQVVTTSNIVADWAKVIGGDRVQVFGLVPPGSDPHSFMPGAQDVAKVADADVVLTIGLGLEADWLEDLVHNASTDESRIIALGEGVDPLEFSGEDDHMDEGGEDHGEMLLGRLLVADGAEAHLSVIDLSTDEVDSGIFDVAGPNARVYPSLTHRYGFVLARGPEDGDDRIHIFDGGVYLEEHGDHFDLVKDPVSRHPLEIVEEWPVHSVNSNGWTTIFADTNGHALLLDEEDLTRSRGNYEPTVLDAGIQHGTAFAITDEHVVMSVSNPLCTVFIPGAWDCLPLGAVVSDLDGEVVYDAASDSCTNLHGEAYNEHGAFFGCQEGVLYIHEHDGHFEHEIIPYPAELGEPGMSAIITYYWHHDSDNFFGIGNRRASGQAGIWLVDPVNREIREIFPDPSTAFVFSNDGETFYILADDGVLRAFDSHDGELIESVHVLEPFERQFGSPSPAMIVVGEWLFLSDPYSGHVLGVHLEHMEIEEEWELGGAPANLAFVGVADSDGDGHDDHEGHDHGPLDPHFWFDPNRVKIAVTQIASQLSAMDPEGASFYLKNAADYAVQLDELHSWIQEQVELVPPDRRLLVTSHDTFAYFADVYGFEVIGALIPSLAPDVEPSAEHLAGLVEVIREHNAPAVFSETTVSGRLPEALARETGAVLAQLYADSLGEVGSAGGTYLGMMRANVEVMVEVLG